MIMRKFIFLLLLPVTIQTIAQDCNIVSKIQNDYLNDAKILALREIYSDSTSSNADSVEIPSSLTNKYLGALSQIYSLDKQVIDSIFNIYDIHASPNVPYMEIAMIGDTNFTWIKNYMLDSLISGNPQFDSIATKYDFKLQSYINLSVGLSMSITTSQYLNLEPLVDSLNTIEGLELVEAMESWAGDGNNIEFSTDSDTLFFDFSIGWGDCPAGCINRKFWHFSIFDCNATYLGISGDNYTSINDVVKSEYNIYPNPVNDILKIEKWEEIEAIDIYDLQGKLIIGFYEGFNQLDLSRLKTGQYLLKIRNRNNDKSTFRIIKR